MCFQHTDLWSYLHVSEHVCLVAYLKKNHPRAEESPTTIPETLYESLDVHNLPIPHF